MVPTSYSKCYTGAMSSLAQVARRSDAAITRSRAELVRAVREAAASGMTQAEIAREIGRSQPEVSRLLHFQGISPRAVALRRHRNEVRHLVRQAGGSAVRVFGSIATGEDHEGSDVDLLFTMGKPLSLMALSRLERQISEAVGMSVDLVPDSGIRPDLRERILGEAVPL